jgi:diacylglycerol kinase family enzyme
MQNISVYFNERAGNSDHDWRGEINSALFRSNIDYKSPKDLTELYTDLDIDVENKVDAILSVGGDGTVNTIIQKLAGTEVGLLVIPGGTANDFAESLGSSQNIKKISQTIRQNVRSKIDLISINGKFMATNGGIGFASEIAYEINELRSQFPNFKNFMKISGKSIYSLFLAKKLLLKNITSYKYRITTVNGSEIFYSPLILINNQPVLGGTFNVAPHTNHQDGTFNLTIFKHSNRIELVQCLLRILNGEFPYDDKNIISYEIDQAKIELLDSNESQSFFGDGEVFESNTSWDIKLHSKFLTVFSPKDQIDLSNICSKVTLM